MSNSNSVFLSSSSCAMCLLNSCKVIQSLIQVVCPNFKHPTLNSSFQVYALCRCCRHASKIVNHHSKAETILKVTVYSQLLQNYFLPGKICILYMIKLGQGVQVRAYYPKGFLINKFSVTNPDPFHRKYSAKEWQFTQKFNQIKRIFS